MKKYEFQFKNPKDKECEEYAEFNTVKWKHKGMQCPLCILLDKEYDLKSLKNCAEEAWQKADRELSAFIVELPFDENQANKKYKR